MIKKLMKYDLKQMNKVLIYYYAIALGLAIITRLINIGNDIQFISIIGSFFTGLTYSAIATILINMFIHIIMVFTTSFYKDQSYLTHTLPVSKNQLLISKYLSALITIIISVAVSVASMFILLYSDEFIVMIKQALESEIPGFNLSVGLVVTLCCFLIFAEFCTIISASFASKIKGYSYNRKKAFKWALWLIIFYLGSVIFTLICAIIVCAITGNIDNLFASSMSSNTFLILLIVSLVGYVIYSIVFYFIAQRLFNKGVNID